MTVFYDANVFVYQRVGGINRYFHEIITRFRGRDRAILGIYKDPISDLPAGPNVEQLRFPDYMFRPRRLAKRLDHWEVVLKLRMRRPGVVHPTTYIESRPGLWRDSRGALVYTVWDMIHEHFAAHLDPDGSVARIKREAVTLADEVMCISEHGKADLLNLVKIPEDKVTVCHLAHNLDVSAAGAVDADREQPYFLYVGSRTIYKNFNVLARAIAQLRSQGRQVRLAVTGPAFSDDESRDLSGLGILDFIDHHGFVDDDHLARLYRGAIAFVFPSFHEGFGIPLLEAMACGTPVVAADRTSFPEVVGDAALLFNPDSTDDLTQRLEALLDDEGLRQKLIALGSRRVKTFSWDAAAKTTLDVYCRAMGKRS